MKSEKASNQSRTAANDNADLHGNAPDKCEVAMLLIDVINDLEFDGGDKLLEHARPMAEKLVALKKRVTMAEIPIIMPMTTLVAGGQISMRKLNIALMKM
jgi:hypothetical protein